MDSDSVFEENKWRPMRLFYYKQIVQIFLFTLEYIDNSLLIFTHYLIQSNKHGTMKAYTKIVQGGKENEKK